MPMQLGSDLQFMLGFHTQYQQQFSRKEAEKFTCVQPLRHVMVLESRGDDSTILTPETALPYHTTEPSVHFGFEYHSVPVTCKGNGALCDGNN
jgi:hypothetical protein